jgi:hypothetical protein
VAKFGSGWIGVGVSKACRSGDETLVFGDPPFVPLVDADESAGSEFELPELGVCSAC